MWDCPDNVISALSGRHRKLLWDNKSIPLRILVMLLCFLLLPVRGTRGGGGGVAIDSVLEVIKV